MPNKAPQIPEFRSSSRSFKNSNYEREAEQEYSDESQTQHALSRRGLAGSGCPTFKNILVDNPSQKSGTVEMGDSRTVQTTIFLHHLGIPNAKPIPVSDRRREIDEEDAEILVHVRDTYIIFTHIQLFIQICIYCDNLDRSTPNAGT